MPPAPPAPSEMNGLVYQYLVAAGLSSTAKKFKKEAAFSGKNDDCDHSLVDIFHFYRTHRPQLEGTDADVDSPVKKRRKLSNGESEKIKAADTTMNTTEKKSKKNRTKKDKSKKESATKIKEAVESQPTKKKVKKSKKSKKKNRKGKSLAAETAAAAPEPKSENGGEETSTSATIPETETPIETNVASSGEQSTVEQQNCESSEQEPSQKKNKKRRRSAPAPNEPFQRVKALDSYEPWQDNRYNPVSSYGAKAHADLIVTRGKGFRHEKTKKKRGSYRGGTISFASNSYKF